MAKDGTMERAAKLMVKDLEKLLRLLLKLIIGLYIWALLLSMEVFDFIDIDIEKGDALPALGWESVLAHGQNMLATLVLLSGIVAAARHFLKQWRSESGDG